MFPYRKSNSTPQPKRGTDASVLAVLAVLLIFVYTKNPGAMVRSQFEYYQSGRPLKAFITYKRLYAKESGGKITT